MTRKQWELWKQGKYIFNLKEDAPTDDGKPFKAIDKNGIEKEYQIRVFAKDGHIPHFHVMNDEDGFDSEICIYEAKYYNGTKDTLSNDQIDKVIEVMLSGANGYSAEEFNGWKFAEIGFQIGQSEERETENFIFDFHIQETCPDYTQLNNNI